MNLQGDAAPTPAPPPGAPGDLPGAQSRQIDLGVVLNIAKLEKLQNAFAERGKQGLDQATFTQVVSDLLRGALGDLDLRLLFMRIDVRGTGRIQWSDVASFLLFGRSSNTITAEESKAFDQDHVPFTSSDVKNAFHQQPVTHIVCHSRLPRYFTSSEDGTVKMWNSSTLSYEHTIHSSTAWISGLAPLTTNPDVLCVSTDDRVLSLYDASTGDTLKVFRGGLKRGLIKGERDVIYRRRIPRRNKQVFRHLGEDESDSTLLAHLKKKEAIEVTPLEGLTHAPTAVGHYCLGDRDGVLVGTDAGHMLLYDLVRELGRTEGAVPCLAKSDFEGERVLGWYPGHQGPITAMKMASSIESVVTSGVDGSLRLTSMERGCLLRALGGMDDQGVDLGHRKAVYGLAWSDQHRIIASCGAERDIVLWNPFITKPLTRLTGSRSPLIDVFFNDNDSQLVSLSFDSAVRIWDLRTWQCVKVLKNKEEVLNAMAYDPKKATIVTASSRLFVRGVVRQSSGQAPGVSGHRSGMVAVLHSKRYKQIVSTDETKVLVWDEASFALLVQWSVPAGITSAVLDATESKLITGTIYGTVLVWNYVSAQLVRTFTCRKAYERKSRCVEISSVMYATAEKPNVDLIITVVANKRLVMLDNREDNNQRGLVVREVDLRVHGIFSLCSALPICILLGTRHGVAVLNKDQMMKPAVLPNLPEPCQWFGILKGPLHAAPPLSEKPDGSAGHQEWKSVDSCIECVLPLTRLGSVVVASRGDGTVGFWSCPTDQSDGDGELFKFSAVHKLGDAVHVMGLDEGQCTLVTGDVHGYVSVYDLSALPCMPSSVLPPPIDHTHIVKRAGFRLFDCNITVLTVADVQDATRLLCGSVKSDLFLCSLNGAVLRCFGLSEVPVRAPLRDSIHAKVCLDAYRRDSLLRDLEAHGGVATQTALYTEAAGCAELFERVSDADFATLLEAMSESEPPMVSLSHTEEDVVVTLLQVEGDALDELAQSMHAVHHTVDHTTVQQKECSSAAVDVQKVAAPSSVRVLPERPLHHITFEDVWRANDLDSRKPMSARPLDERQRGRGALVPHTARKYCTSDRIGSDELLGVPAELVESNPIPSIADLTSKLGAPPPEVLAAQKAALIPPAPPKSKRSQRKGKEQSAAPKHRVRYCYPDLSSEPPRVLHKAPVTRYRTEAQRKDAQRSQCLRKGVFDLMHGTWTRDTVADYDDWVKACVVDEVPQPLLFWSSDTELAQLATRAPQIVSTDSAAYRRHGVISGHGKDSRCSSRMITPELEPAATNMQQSEPDAHAPTRRTPSDNQSEGPAQEDRESSGAEEVHPVSESPTPSASMTLTDPQKERLWFERAKAQHPPAKRRHMKYDVSSVPLRALMHLSVSDPAKVSDPKKHHQTKQSLGSTGVSKEVEAVLDKAAHVTVPSWVYKRPVKTMHRGKEGGGDKVQVRIGLAS